MSYLWFLLNLWGTFTSWISRPRAPKNPIVVVDPVTKKPTVDLVATLAQYLLANSLSAGPFPTTGGVIHKITLATATLEAGLIIKYAEQFNLKVSLVTSYVEQESAGDDLAIDPNNQIAKHGETAAQQFAHTDIGIAQLDGSTLEGMPEFKDSSIPAIQAKAYDPNWALLTMCQMIYANGVAISKAFKANPALLNKVPNKDIRIAKANSYNAGVHGTLLQLATDKPNLAYGSEVIARADKLAPLLDVA